MKICKERKRDGKNRVSSRIPCEATVEASSQVFYVLRAALFLFILK